MENSYLLKSLQTMFDTKFVQIESKLEELIDNKCVQENGRKQHI